MNIVKTSTNLNCVCLHYLSGEDLNRYLPDNYVYKRWNIFTNDLQVRAFKIEHAI